MKSDRNDGLAATQLAAPSPADPTRTSEPLPAASPQPTLASDTLPAGPQLRDPTRYQILSEHGRGGLGRVSRAHDRELGRDIAIKELISRGHLGEVRFLREALITARLEHPGIVPVYEAGRWADGTPFYAMKLVAGRSLHDLLAERTTVDDRIALLHHVIAVADAIAYAHGRNIIHRDLKPANVIVGDFGETVVIDWGLAKDLTATEESTIGGGPFRANHDDGLTSAGSVLGTPAYMAPEQARGEPVDQRADVFAIGAMLWELCSLQKLPPSFAGQRRRILGRAGIDEDLTTIIDKALDPDPAHRYPDAAALAADLKAFKAGTRIAARRYSPWATLSHWLRRHRAAALSVATAVILVASGIAVYVRNIAIERGRVEATKDDLTLKHAELLLRTDPTAAVSALASYRGKNTTRAIQISAEARGRGIAHPILTAHSDKIHLLAGLPDSSILSIGEDRRIALTSQDIVTTLASDVAVPVIARYSSAQRLLAYSSTDLGTVLLSLETRRMTKLSATRPYVFSFTDDGSRLAVLDRDTMLTVWSIESQPRIVWQRRLPGNGHIFFAGKHRIIVATPVAYTVISLNDAPDSVLTTSSESYDANSEHLVIGDNLGAVRMFRLSDLQILGSVTVCRTRVNAVRFIPRRSVIAFACEESSAGIIDYSSTFSIRERFSMIGTPFAVTSSEDGHLAIVTGDSSTAYIHDVDNRLTRRYESQATLAYVSAPTSAYHRILTGDINGTIRIWDPPSSSAFAAMQSGVDLHRVAISPDGGTIAAGAADGNIFLTRLSDRAQSVRHGHTSYVEGVRFMPNGLLLSYGFDGKVHAWTTDFSLVHTFDGHQSRVEDLDLIDHGRQVLSVGDDGRLFRWSPNDDRVSVLFSTHYPLINLEALAVNDTAVVADLLGSVWHVRDKDHFTLLRPPNGDQVTLLRSSPDGRLVAIGTRGGNVTIFDSITWRVSQTIKMNGPLRQGMFAPDNSRIALASERYSVQLVPLSSSASGHWEETPLGARAVSFSPDGGLLAILCSNGDLWFYSFLRGTWIYARDHASLTSSGRFTPDGRLFLSSDIRGTVVVRDVSMTLLDSVLPYSR